MKKLLTIAALFLCGAASALETAAVFDHPVKITAPSQALAIQVYSKVADGTAAVKCESRVYENANDIHTDYFTNISYQVVFSNGTDIVTNVTDYVPLPLPGPRALISYTTNTVVTTVVTTNIVRQLAAVITNSLGSVTCADGFGEAILTNKFLPGFSSVWFDGTAKGDVILFLKK